jgi:hypothetical protein
MEVIIIGLIVVGALGYFAFFRKKDEAVTPAAPYKVETQPAAPAPVVAETPAPVVVEETPAPAPVVVEDEPIIVDETPVAKKTRKPRAPKAAPVAEKKPVAKKPVAKKPAAKKPVAIKAKSKSKKA